MILGKIKNLINTITEEWVKPHSMVQQLEEIKKSNPQNLKTMSPRYLYRKKGLNITKYNTIMKKYGIRK